MPAFSIRVPPRGLTASLHRGAGRSTTHRPMDGPMRQVRCLTSVPWIFGAEPLPGCAVTRSRSGGCFQSYRSSVLGASLPLHSVRAWEPYLVVWAVALWTTTLGCRSRTLRVAWLAFRVPRELVDCDIPVSHGCFTSSKPVRRPCFDMFRRERAITSLA